MGFRPGSVPDEVMRIYNEEGFGDLPDTLVSNDPPSHTRYRKLVDRPFTAGPVRRLEDYMVVVVGELIDAFIEKGRLRAMQAESEEHTSELQSLMRNSYAAFCWKKKKNNKIQYTDSIR